MYGSKSFCTTLSDAEPASASNLAQVIAVGTICNAASFDNSPDEKTDGKAVPEMPQVDFAPFYALAPY